MSIPDWKRLDTRATGRVADVVLVVFHRGPLLENVPMSASQYGAPSPESVGKVDVVAIEDPTWIAGWRSGSIRAVAERELSAPELADLDAADRCHLVRATILDPPHLTYLRAAWAIARWLVARGARGVLDAYPIRFHSAARVREQDVAAAIDVKREVSVIFETEPEATRLGHVVHTRGMKKLARPDLIALVEPRIAASTGAMLYRLAASFAEGWMPVAGAQPELGVTVSPLGAEDQLAQALHLENDAWLVEVGDAKPN